MADILAQVERIDRMTGQMNVMINTFHILNVSVNDVGDALQSCFDPGRFIETPKVLGIANDELKEMSPELEKAKEAQELLNERIKKGQAAIDGMTGKITKMMSGLAEKFSFKKLAGMSDEMVRTQAKINSMNDGLQTTRELEDKIFASAQNSRMSYAETASQVAKLSSQTGSLFGSNDETIAFVENLNKSFALAGASQQEISSATGQLTQALGTGVVSAQTLNSVFASAPNLLKTIADYTRMGPDELMKMAEAGNLTSEMVKNAMLSATGEIGTQFDSMPMTWGQIWTDICNKAYYAAQPLLSVINWLAQNWSVLQPVVIGIALAVGLFALALGVCNGIQKVSNGIQNISNGIQAISATRTAMKTGITLKDIIATKSAQAAQLSLNTALLACPLAWIILGIIAVIAIIYLVVAAINNWLGTSISAMGIIAGAVMTVAAVIGNIVIGLHNMFIGRCIEIYNFIALLANFLGNVFNDPVSAIAHLFVGLLDIIAGAVQSAAKLIDAVLGTDFSGSIAGFRDQINTGVDDLFGEQTVVMEKLDSRDYEIPRIDYGDAFDAGYGWGQGMEDKIGGLFGDGLDFNFNDEVDKFDPLLKGYAPDNGQDYTPELNENVSSINENTGRCADEASATSEELEYLRDLAEQEIINRFTTAEIKVDMINNNNVNSNLDLDGIVNYVAVGVQSAMEQAAEGVHV